MTALTKVMNQVKFFWFGFRAKHSFHSPHSSIFSSPHSSTFFSPPSNTFSCSRSTFSTLIVVLSLALTFVYFFQPLYFFYNFFYLLMPFGSGSVLFLTFILSLAPLLFLDLIFVYSLSCTY